MNFEQFPSNDQNGAAKSSRMNEEHPANINNEKKKYDSNTSSKISGSGIRAVGQEPNNEQKNVSFESMSDPIVQKEVAIAEGEIKPEDRLQNQIRLAREVFDLLHDDQEAKLETLADRNEIMMFWSTENFSQLYRDLEKDDFFLNHPRLAGNIYKITGEDMIAYKLKNSFN